MFKTILLSLFLTSSLSFAKTVKVAVIDTGYDFNSNWDSFVDKKKDNRGVTFKKPKMCDTKEHLDLTGEGIQDDNGHGTHVVGIIAKYAEDADYCVVVIKAFGSKTVTFQQATLNTAKAFKYAKQIGVDMINISGGGVSFDIAEYEAVKEALDAGIIIVAAAGNENKAGIFNKVKKYDYVVFKVTSEYLYSALNHKAVYTYKVKYINQETSEVLNHTPENTYFPANYDARIISVSNLESNGKKLNDSSNFGAAVKFSEIGTNEISLLPNNKIGPMTGTSQAAPKKLGKMLKNWR